MKDRIYVCHTYYHVYVTFLKEMNLPSEKQGKATLLLSQMTTDFSNIFSRISSCGVFEEVLLFDEKRETFFPELSPYINMTGNQIKIMFGRMKFTKLLGKLQEPFIPVDFMQYKDIYVYCDSDPIGYYLNYKKIYYHALEDGLNTLREFPSAWNRNHKFFRLKKLLSSMNLLFIEDGFGKYCIDMEVDSMEGLQHINKKYFAVPRADLEENLSRNQIDIILRTFIENFDLLKSQISGKDAILVLTEPLCDMETRERIFRDIVSMYDDEGEIIFKPHPSDTLDYSAIFPNHIVIHRKIPMEMMNFMDGVVFKKVVSVFTELGGITFSDHKIRLGSDFMDKYESPDIHRYKQ